MPDDWNWAVAAAELEPLAMEKSDPAAFTTPAPALKPIEPVAALGNVTASSTLASGVIYRGVPASIELDPPPAEKGAGITREVLAISGLYLVNALLIFFVFVTVWKGGSYNDLINQLAGVVAAADLLGVGFYFGTKRDGA